MVYHRRYAVNCAHSNHYIRTGVAPIFVDSKGENSIVIVGGANDLLTVEEVERARPAIASCRILACQMEIDPIVSLCALRVAHEEGVSVARATSAMAHFILTNISQVTTLFNPAAHARFTVQ